MVVVVEVDGPKITLTAHLNDGRIADHEIHPVIHGISGCDGFDNVQHIALPYVQEVSGLEDCVDFRVEPVLHGNTAVVERVIDHIAVQLRGVEFVCDFVTVEKRYLFTVKAQIAREVVYRSGFFSGCL